MPLVSESHAVHSGNVMPLLAESACRRSGICTSRVIAFLLRILIGITAGALFSGIFWIECTIATKKNTRSVVFMELCLLDLLLMIIPAVWLLLA